MDKMSTYHPAITHRFWLVVILTINQTIATLYCAKVAVIILRTSVLSVTRHPHSVKIRCRYPALDFTVTESVGHFGQLKKPDELPIQDSLPGARVQRMQSFAPVI